MKGKRAVEKTVRLRANAIISMDMESFQIYERVTVIYATITAVEAEELTGKRKEPRKGSRFS